MLLMALLGAHWRYAQPEAALRLGLIGRLAVTVLVAGVAAWLGHGALSRSLESRELKAAETADSAAAQLERLRAAHALEPLNSETCFSLGEVLRVLAWPRYDGYDAQVREAMAWFQRAWTLNPYDGYARLRYGMCLDLLDQHRQATPYFLAAEKLDPNGAFTLTHVGWHYCQLEDWATAKKYLQLAATKHTRDREMMDIFQIGRAHV